MYKSHLDTPWCFRPSVISLLLFVKAYVSCMATRRLAVVNLWTLCATRHYTSSPSHTHTHTHTHTLLFNPTAWASPDSHLLAYKNCSTFVKSQAELPLPKSKFGLSFSKALKLDRYLVCGI